MSLNVLTRGAGRVMLLLHGFTGTARTWSRQIDAWGTDHHVIAPDLLGHGRSDAPTDPAAYALERQVAAVADLLELLDAGPADVIGYSMGARLALVLALEHPGSVARLVLESPSAGIADEVERARRRETDERLADDIEADGMEAFVRRWEAMRLFATHARLAEDVRADLRNERLSHDPRGLAASLRGAGQGAMQPLYDRLSSIAFPALVLAGALDAVGHSRARSVAEALPLGTLRVITAAGHTPHLERPDAFIAAVDAFLAPPAKSTH